MRHGAELESFRDLEREQRLVERFRGGDPEALGTLFEMYVDRVFGFTRHILRSHEDAEEATTEVFIRAFEHAHAFRGEGSFKSWLFRIARNLCLDRLRQPRLLGLEAEESELYSDRGRGAGHLDTQLLVRSVVGELPEEQRQILLLCDVEQWDAKEVAQMLGKSLPATKSTLYRARRALRDKLAEVWGEEIERDEV